MPENVLLEAVRRGGRRHGRRAACLYVVLSAWMVLSLLSLSLSLSLSRARAHTHYHPSLAWLVLAGHPVSLCVSTRTPAHPQATCHCAKYPRAEADAKRKSGGPAVQIERPFRNTTFRPAFQPIHGPEGWRRGRGGRRGRHLDGVVGMAGDAKAVEAVEAVER